MKTLRSRLLWTCPLLMGVLLLWLLWLLYPSQLEPVWNGKSISVWIKQLSFHDSTGGVTAEEAILQLGPKAIPYLIRDLRKKDIRFLDLWVSIYPKLPDGLRRRFALPVARHTLRYNATRGLELLGPAAASSSPWLETAMSDKDRWVRTGAVGALGAIGPEARFVTPRLVAGLKDSDPNYRLACLIALKRMYRGSEDMDRVYVGLLQDTDWNFRAHVAEALEKSSGQSPEIAAALVAALRDPRAEVISRTATALGRKPQHAVSSVPALLEALNQAELKSEEPVSLIVMWKILEALGELGPNAKSAIPALTNLIGSKLSIVGTLSAIAWGKIETNNPVPIARLIEKLGIGEPSDQFWATWALGKRGQAARDALAVLEALAKRRPDDRNLQIMIAAALWRIDPQRPNPTKRIIELAGERFKQNGDYETIRLLGELGPAASEAVPVLLEAYKSSGGSMQRDFAMDALQRVDPDAAAHPWR